MDQLGVILEAHVIQDMSNLGVFGHDPSQLARFIEDCPEPTYTSLSPENLKARGFEQVYDKGEKTPVWHKIYSITVGRGLSMTHRVHTIKLIPVGEGSLADPPEELGMIRETVSKVIDILKGEYACFRSGKALYEFISGNMRECDIDESTIPPHLFTLYPVLATLHD